MRVFSTQPSRVGWGWGAVLADVGATSAQVNDCTSGPVHSFPADLLFEDRERAQNAVADKVSTRRMAMSLSTV
jgi:hypothetical protein